jgi:hypothetical protein
MHRPNQSISLNGPSHRQRAASLAVLLAILASGCLAESNPVEGSGAAQGIVVDVQPRTATLAPGAPRLFAATVTGTADTGVTWSIREGAPGGSVSTSGSYVAPATAGTFHVVATSVADPARSASSVIDVQALPPPPPVTVTLTPGSASAFGCQTATFSATVTGATNTAVTWSVQEAGGGTVSAAGVYTAPAVAGTYHVVATSAAAPTSSATAPIAVTTKVLSITATPATATVQAGGTVQLIATVTTTCGSTSSLMALQAQPAGSAN